MEHTTKAEVEHAFTILCRACGKQRNEWTRGPDGKHYAIVGSWTLSKDIGGYVVEEISNESGGVSCPLGYRRRSAKEFVEAVRFATDAIEAYRRSKID